MDAVPITSTAPAVHRELIRALAERARIHRLRDRPVRGRDQPQGASFAAGQRLSASHDEPGARVHQSVVSRLPYVLPRSFGPIGLDSPPGLDAAVTLCTPARPTRLGTVG
jgi:hypothetical protein